MSVPSPSSLPPLQTRFVCTLGPFEPNSDLPQRLAAAGMSIARINGAHGSLEEVEGLIRQAQAALGEAVPILLDLPGCKLRTDNLGPGVMLEEGTEFRLERAMLTIPEALDLLEPGQRISAADGHIELEVLALEADHAQLHVHTGGHLGQRKGLNVAGLGVNLPFDLERDIQLVEIAKRTGVAYLGLSFVRRAEQVRRYRAWLVDAPIRLVAKVETAEALEDLDGILAETDLVMIDRGDLEADIGRANVPLATRDVLRRARELEVPSIVASQFLLSMLERPLPSMAEVSDMAHAVLDGADHLMLSEETAIGRHPVACLEQMRAASHAAEQVRDHRYDAVILAAGDSPGLGSLTTARHKCMLDVGGTTIIRHQLDNLEHCGIPSERVTIVTGHAAASLEAYLRAEGFRGQFVINPWYRATNIMASLWLARPVNPTVVVYGDILFDREILRDLLAHPSPLAMAIDEDSECTPEDEKVRLMGGAVVEASKELSAESSQGEFIGLLKADRNATHGLAAAMDALIREDRMDAFLTAALLRASRDAGVQLTAVPTQKRPWSDNDFLPDLERSRRQVWPALRAAHRSEA